MSAQSPPAGAPYRGEDRRLTRASPGSERPPAAIALCCLLGIAVAFFAGPFVAPTDASTEANRLVPLLDSAALAVAVIIGVLCLLRWRILGRVCALWLAGAALTYGLLVIGVGHLLRVVLPAQTDASVLAFLHPASRLVVIALLFQAIRSPDVDVRARPSVVAALVIAGTGGLTVLFQVAPDLGRSLAGADDFLAQNATMRVGSFVLIALFLALATGFLLRGQRRGPGMFLWFAVLAVGLALAEAHRLLPSGDLGYWGIGDGVLRLGGLLAALTGTTRDLLSAFTEQGGRLLESVATGATAEVRIRAEHAANEERAHEARNALTAIEGATKTLERYRDRLDPDTRESLMQAISGEIHRLQQLVSVERTQTGLASFLVEKALRNVLAAARSGGEGLEVDIPLDLRAYGRGPETAEVVQNLLVNARRYAPDSPVALRASEEQGGVVIRVEDRGPGVAEEERRLIFSRGVRGSASRRTDGSGLGLYVSLELMRDQGGDLWVEDRPGGGASFALWLPADAPERTGAAAAPRLRAVRDAPAHDAAPHAPDEGDEAGGGGPSRHQTGR
jgi:signal transduction histidine kinase